VGSRKVITDELVGRIEGELAHDCAAVVRSIRALQPESEAAVVERAGGVVAFTGPGLFVNRAVGMGVGTDATGDDVDFVIEFFDERRMPAEIELCPFADDRVRARASERGFTVAWFHTAYVCAIDTIEPAPKGATTFELVESEATFVQWAAIHRAIIGDDAPDTLDGALRARNAVPGSNSFLVQRDGHPIGACSVTVHDGVATFGGMGVLPDFRNVGIQMDCIAFRLEVARDLGCDLAIVTVTPGSSSARNIERAGFVPRYTSACLRRPR
jgi:GNAT superfamily N-acetyltransferase